MEKKIENLKIMENNTNLEDKIIIKLDPNIKTDKIPPTSIIDKNTQQL